MRQRSLWIAAGIAALLFVSGCTQQALELDGAQTGKNNVSDATQIAGDTVSIDENSYGNENSANSQNGSSTDSGNSQKGSSTDTTNFNSSSNGFQSIYFGFGDYGISNAMENRIATNTEVLTRSNTKIKIAGNCDEFGTDEYNYALGLKRAKAVRDSLITQGANASRMAIISYGESNPVCSNPTDSCYAQNRRVDLSLAK